MVERNNNQCRQEDIKEGDEPPFWERVVAFLGLLLVLASLGYLLYQGIWGDNSPPDVVIEQEAILNSGKDYLVRFKARNFGGETAAEVQVTGTLSQNGQEIEKVETVIDYIPAGSEQRGGLYFSNDPSTAELELRASGYRVP